MRKNNWAHAGGEEAYTKSRGTPRRRLGIEQRQQAINVSTEPIVASQRDHREGDRIPWSSSMPWVVTIEVTRWQVINEKYDATLIVLQKIGHLLRQELSDRSIQYGEATLRLMLKRSRISSLTRERNVLYGIQVYDHNIWDKLQGGFSIWPAQSIKQNHGVQVEARIGTSRTLAKINLVRCKNW